MTRRVWISVTTGGALLVVAFGIMIAPWWRRHHVGRWLGDAWPVLTLVGLGIAVIVFGVQRWGRTRTTSESTAVTQQPLRPMPGWMIWVAAVVVGIITCLATALLIDRAALPVGGDVERAKLRIETIKTGLSIGAGAAGALALLLAARRQWLAERTQQATEYDAGERRVTELYVKAADQLGSDKAPVRLAGLYALERLAQDNPAHRQTIVNVICAYLRMPFTPPDDQRTQYRRCQVATVIGRPRPVTSNAPISDPREELQVRLTAQRVLRDHLELPENMQREDAAWLRPEATLKFWPGMSLDLAGATLINFNLSRSFIDRVKFEGATFSGVARFNKAAFSGEVRFCKVTFLGNVEFNEAVFSGVACFEKTAFSRKAWFGGVAFSGDVRFGGATFSQQAWFYKATFAGQTGFDGVMFAGNAWFQEAIFAGCPKAGELVTAGPTEFGMATFAGARFDRRANFDGATFARNADFDGTAILADLSDPVPSGWVVEVDETNPKFRSVVWVGRAGAELLPETADESARAKNS